ncbi:MAG: hypothetical protein M1818_002527 [Claussenomyces sp. TS43310]|nr:MAG: hypothetical protein M1818_002527 [Claussenomyces sp. TS43310]
MKSSCTTLYPNEQVAIKVSDYAEKQSTKLPQNLVDLHAEVSEHHERAIYMVSTLQAQFQIWFTKAIGAKRVLEIGCFIGFSALAWSHAVGPEGHVTTLEFSPEYAAIAEGNFAKNGVKNVQVIVGDARESLKKVASELTEPYDIIFVDADKISYPVYFALIMEFSQPSSQIRLLRPGGLIIADNILRQGLVADHSDANPARNRKMPSGAPNFVKADNDALDEFNKMMVRDERLETFVLPVFDGLGMARMLD